MPFPTLRDLPPPPEGRKGWPWTEGSPSLPITMADGTPWPRISIVTPSYNQAGFLEETIRSVLLQGYPNLEYIVVDGGSTDGSETIIEKYGPWISYWVSEPDSGQTEALNKGFERCSGLIMGWQNSDDIYLPGAFFEAAEAFRKDPGADLVFGNAKLIDGSSSECGELRFVPFSRRALILEGTMLLNQAAFWRRKLFLAAGPLDPSMSFCMDFEFFLRASAYGRFCFIRKFLGAYRQHEEAKSSTISHIGRREHAKVLRRLGMGGSGLGVRAQRVLSAIRRAFFYAIQGDLGYLVRGIVRRVRETAREGKD